MTRHGAHNALPGPSCPHCGISWAEHVLPDDSCPTLVVPDYPTPPGPEPVTTVIEGFVWKGDPETDHA